MQHGRNASGVWMRGLTLLLACALLAGCKSKRGPEVEGQLIMPRAGPTRIAVTPMVNLSGVDGPDPLLQADLVYQQLQQMHRVSAVPVNRTVAVMAALRIVQIESQEQASLLCQQLGVDALVVPTITLFDPYNPPRMGASLTMFARDGSFVNARGIDPRELARSASPLPTDSLTQDVDFLQAAGVFDASSGSVRMRLEEYARGRIDPTDPMGPRRLVMDMDSYSAFVWHSLLRDLIGRIGR